MINGDPHDFINTIYSGQDVPYSYRGKKYWFQGYDKDGGCHMEIMECFAPYNYLWEYDGPDYQECGDAFQEAPIFDGKTFWDVEHEIEWLDE